MLFVLFAVSVITFLIFNVIPNGDPAERMAGKIPTETNIAAIREEWGFNESVFVQYGTMMKKVFTGDLESYFTQLNVGEEIMRGLPATLSLAIGAAILWLAVSIAFGLYSAMRAGKIGRPGAHDLALVGISMPVFWIGALMNHYLGLQAGALPQRRLRAAHREPGRLALPHDPAVDRAVDPVHRLLLARAALQRARHDQRGLRAHRARQGPVGAPGDDRATCCATR